MTKKVGTFVAAILLASTQSLAAKPKENENLESTRPEAVVEVKIGLETKKEYEALLKDAENPQRISALASTDVPAIEGQFDADFKVMRDELIGNGRDKKGAQTVADLNRIIEKYADDKTFDALSNQAKFLALQLRAIRPYKSFIFRARRYVGTISVTRTMIVSMLRAQVAGINTFFPTSRTNPVNHWDLVFQYVTEPVDGMGPPIDTDEQLYVFVTQATGAASRITAAFASIVVDKKPIWWDNKLYLSFANFVSENDRYVLLGTPEQYSILSGLALNLSSMMSTSAYSLTGLQATNQKIGQLFGIDLGLAANVFNGQGADGMSSESRIRVLNSESQLFTLVSDGKKRMELAHRYLVSGARFAKLAYTTTKRLPEGGQNLFDPRIANAFTRIAGTGFGSIDELVGGEPVASTIINGERIRVSLENFYKNPPRSLKEMYPVAWDQSPDSRRVEAWGRTETLRNYRTGMAVGWNYAAYKKIFPDIRSADGRTTTEVPKYARVLTQTWGASVFALPLAAVIY